MAFLRALLLLIVSETAWGVGIQVDVIPNFIGAGVGVTTEWLGAKDTITAVVPEGLDLGGYDVKVINPPSNGGFGELKNGFRVVSMPIPIIEAVVPSRGEPSTSVMVDIYGSNFRAPITVQLLDGTGAVVATDT